MLFHILCYFTLFHPLNGSIIPLCCYLILSMVLLSFFVAISPPQWFSYPSMLLYHPLNDSIIPLCAIASPQWFNYPYMLLFHHLNGAVIPLWLLYPLYSSFISPQRFFISSLWIYYITFIAVLSPSLVLLYPLYIY